MTVPRGAWSSTAKLPPWAVARDMTSSSKRWDRLLFPRERLERAPVRGEAGVKADRTHAWPDYSTGGRRASLGSRRHGWRSGGLTYSDARAAHPRAVTAHATWPREVRRGGHATWPREVRRGGHATWPREVRRGGHATWPREVRRGGHATWPREVTYSDARHQGRYGAKGMPRGTNQGRYSEEGDILGRAAHPSDVLNTAGRHVRAGHLGGVIVEEHREGAIGCVDVVEISDMREGTGSDTRTRARRTCGTTGPQ